MKYFITLIIIFKFATIVDTATLDIGAVQQDTLDIGAVQMNPAVGVVPKPVHTWYNSLNGEISF